MSINSRKSYFSIKKNLKKYDFDPEFIYTFDFHQHVLKVDIFKMDLGLMQYDIFNVLGMYIYTFYVCL
jgi:phosphomevalonate kinase